MKTAISIPDAVFRRAEDFARRSRMSRSALFTKAVAEFVEYHQRGDVTERLNRVYEKEHSAPDLVLKTIQSLSMAKEDW